MATKKDEEHPVPNVSAEAAVEEPAEVVRRREAKEHATTVDGSEARERAEKEPSDNG